MNTTTIRTYKILVEIVVDTFDGESAYAAIMANAESFGGIDSTSFKIKKKHLIRCLKI